ncbi:MULTISPECIES: monovalent cation/H+ antiporter subunit A [Acinetobacter]|jgi:multicomponent K+:H+ antiporter subunit A|uniref:Monovalent cation/H+ antiporter subunit A n=1 Tax=Acinetobacter johnsonii TaxID=40214 RepID=A0AAW6RQ67_ACIJO|nr:MULTISPECIES: monovalent cation/H+ antiporter subunit A [Acinetobacter]MBO7704335.1 monovalent cation/H+ antiporter subunit A [Acinetobacter sp.]MCV2451105.1 monovalent cation/H+ antiporter subunit A [Acinetobacter johnsonii]MDG9786609.1 monovalent cation/H+ antiporter subunit A [Acinetobacter johnsonii]MDG9797567.1 monovalent cation/H+ antiporter subunit A [Acinetobacter johnsonii]MDH1239631.1 monovalent cation/H+ antiporter subunit A [Acinetobacter johnsonii]
METSVLPIIILLPLILGTTLVSLLKQSSRRLTAFAAVGVSMTSLGLLLTQAREVFNGAVITQSWSWLPQLGIDFSFRLDALGLLFALLISGIGTLIYIYAYFYLGPKNSLNKLYLLLMLFMAAMLGISLSNNLILLLIFWELTSISSFLLVGYWSNYDAAQRGSRMALTITGMGGLAMLGGFILLGQITGTYEIDQILTMTAQIQSHALFVPTLLLILLGAFTKSAQFPFHFWLPNAMAAPTPVSAYLHSATMVKAGIFLVARLLPIFAGAALFHNLVTFIGLFTLCMAAFFAIFKEDLKGLLAYSTISHLGLIMCLLGIGSPLAVAAAIFHIINHATFKAALFMIAGIIDHESGTRDLRKLSGLWQLLPYTATLTMVTAASMAGVPLTNGFLSKEMFFTELLSNLSGPVLICSAIVATLAGIFAVAYSVRLVHGVFFDGPLGKQVPNKDAHEPPFGMRAPATLLAILCILVGLFPALLVENIVNSTARASTQVMDFEGAHLALWHGFNMPLLMSLIASIGGLIFYFSLAKGGKIREIDLDPYLGRLQGRVAFDLFLKSLLLNSRKFKRWTENGKLQSYILWIVIFSIAVVSLPFLGQGLTTGTRELTHAPALAIVLWLLLFSSCWMMLWFHHERIKAVLISGAIGLVVTMVFICFSAPDLALTQITVDVVTTVLLLMSLSLLPQLTPYESSVSRRWRDALIAIGGGLGIAWITWLILTRDHNSISWFFMQQSIPLGGGTNVVNVILVDFRGFDTFGEITVLGIAGIGALCLMDGMRTHGTTMTQGLSYRFNPSPLMLRITASWILPIALVVSLYIFLRGHNLPGGGFIAGLITALALIIQYMALGQDHAEQLLKAKSGRLYEIWIGTGLVIAGLTGLGAWFWGRPFLTSAHFYVSPPILGEMHLATAALFDVGVYITVVGATMLLISVLGDSRHSSMSGPVPKGD